MGLATIRRGARAAATLPRAALLLLLLAGGCATAQPPGAATPAGVATGESRTVLTDASGVSISAARQPEGTLLAAVPSARNAPGAPAELDAAVSPAARSGEARRTAAFRVIAPASAAREALGYDYILLGETHTSACDHKAQAAFLTAMLAEGARPALGLEMAPRDAQAALDGFSRGTVPLAGLAAAVDWERIWGHDFELYRPVFAVADEARLPVFGLNVPPRVVRQVSRGGIEGVEAQDRVWLPPSIIAPAPEQRAALGAVFREHMAMRAARGKAPETPDAPGAPGAPGAKERTGAPGMAKTGVSPVDTRSGGVAEPQAKDAGGTGATPAQAPSSVTQSVPSSATPAAAPAGADAPLERFLLVQSLWDSGMAYEAVRVRVAHGGPVVILAGGGHVEYGWGIARRIRLLDPGARVLLVMPWRVNPEAGVAALPDPEQADMFWVCRSQPEPERPGMRGPGGGGSNGDNPAGTAGTARPRLGLALRQEQDGARVEQVEPGSVAERAGFLPGDVILRVNDRAVDGLRVLHEAGVAAFAAGRDVRFNVRRQEGERVLSIPGARATAPAAGAASDPVPDGGAKPGGPADGGMPGGSGVPGAPE